MATGTITNEYSTDRLEDVFKRLSNGEHISITEIDSIVGVCHDIFIDSKYIDSFVESDSEMILNEEFWCSILGVIAAESLSEKTINFLYKHEIAVISMCHKNLPDEWLIKYSVYDDEPLYKLADRYMKESDDKSFAKFVVKYALNSESLFGYLVKYVTYSSKWKALTFLGMQSENYNIRTFAKDCVDIFQIGISVDAEQIRSAYEMHKKDPDWLLSIAKNPNTSLDILKDLSSISHIQLAKRIRMAANETISLKQTFLKPYM